MKILIFSMSEDAAKLAEKLREGGGGKTSASLRDPHFFSDDASQYEPADDVYCDRDDIEAVYAAKEVKVTRLDSVKAKPGAKKKAAKTKKGA